MNNLAIKIDEQFLGLTHPLSKIEGIGDLVSLLVKFVFVVSGITILLFIILGGIGMIAGAGNSNPEQIEKGKQSVTSALIGFVIVFVAYWIVQLIEIWTGIKIF